MELKLHLLESFQAQGSDGETYKVCGYERLAPDYSLADGGEHWEPTGVAEYRLSDGQRVDVLPDGTMTVERAGTRLTLQPLARP